MLNKCSLPEWWPKLSLEDGLGACLKTRSKDPLSFYSTKLELFQVIFERTKQALPLTVTSQRLRSLHKASGCRNPSCYHQGFIAVKDRSLTADGKETTHASQLALVTSWVGPVHKLTA